MHRPVTRTSPTRRPRGCRGGRRPDRSLTCGGRRRRRSSRRGGRPAGRSRPDRCHRWGRHQPVQNRTDRRRGARRRGGHVPARGRSGPHRSGANRRARRRGRGGGATSGGRNGCRRARRRGRGGGDTIGGRNGCRRTGADDRRAAGRGSADGVGWRPRRRPAGLHAERSTSTADPRLAPAQRRGALPQARSAHSGPAAAPRRDAAGTRPAARRSRPVGCARVFEKPVENLCPAASSTVATAPALGAGVFGEPPAPSAGPALRVGGGAAPDAVRCAAPSPGACPGGPPRFDPPAGSGLDGSSLVVAPANGPTAATSAIRRTRNSDPVMVEANRPGTWVSAVSISAGDGVQTPAGQRGRRFGLIRPGPAGHARGRRPPTRRSHGVDGAGALRPDLAGTGELPADLRADARSRRRSAATPPPGYRAGRGADGRADQVWPIVGPRPGRAGCAPRPRSRASVPSRRARSSPITAQSSSW